MKLHTKILLGLVVGAVAGTAANLTLGGDHKAVWFVHHYIADPVGQIFLRLLFMVVMPLVFASITLGVANIGDIRRLGRMGGKALGYFAVSTALAATLGLAGMAVIKPGEAIPLEMRQKLMTTFAVEASSRTSPAPGQEFGIQTFVNIVTRNPLQSAVEFDMMGIIFFGILFGAALTLIAAEKAKPMILWLESLNEVVTKIIGMAMNLAPIGVAGLIFGVTARFGWTLLKPLGVFVAVVMAGLILHSVVTLGIIIRYGIGMSPLRFYSSVKEALLTAFSTSSSSATLPTKFACAEKNLGIPPSVSGFVLPLGTTMCMNGTALFEGMTIIFLCQVFGIGLTLGQMAVAMVMAVITAVGAAGVPGGSIPLLVGVLTMFGVPGEAIAIILGVDRIMDMSRTTVNVLSDLTATAFVARSEGLWTPPGVEGSGAGGGDSSSSSGTLQPG